MLDAYPTFHITDLHTTVRAPFGIRQFRAFTAHDHKPCMKVLFDSSFVQMFATSFFLFYPMINVLTFGYAIPTIRAYSGIEPVR